MRQVSETSKITDFIKEIHMADDHTDLDDANRERAKEEERYRDEVSKGGHGAHKPCEKFPIEEANEQGVLDESQGDVAKKSA
jgi:hypothetical protein